MLKLWWRLRTTTQKYWASQVVLVSRSVVPDSLRPHGLQPTRLLCPWDFPGKDTARILLPFAFPGIFLTQGSNPDLLHCRQILYRLSYKGTLPMRRDKEELSSIPGWKRSLGGKHGNSLQYSCLENPMDREAWQARVHGVPGFQFFVCLGFFLCLLGCFCSWVRAMSQNYVLCISEITQKSYIDLVDVILQGIFVSLTKEPRSSNFLGFCVPCDITYEDADPFKIKKHII